MFNSRSEFPAPSPLKGGGIYTKGGDLDWGCKFPPFVRNTDIQALSSLRWRVDGGEALSVVQWGKALGGATWNRFRRGLFVAGPCFILILRAV